MKIVAAERMKICLATGKAKSCNIALNTVY